MLKKRLAPVLLLCVCAAFPLQAATVSFMVIETGLPGGGDAHQYSILWENGLLDVFFEQGHIVSNARILRVYEKPEDGLPVDAEGELLAAREGGAEFFVIAIVNYPPAHGQEALKPREVSLRLFKTSPAQLLYERRYTDNGSKTSKEAFENMKKAVVTLIPHLRSEAPRLEVEPAIRRGI